MYTLPHKKNLLIKSALHAYQKDVHKRIYSPKKSDTFKSLFSDCKKGPINTRLPSQKLYKPIMSTTWSLSSCCRAFKVELRAAWDSDIFTFCFTSFAKDNQSLPKSSVEIFNGLKIILKIRFMYIRMKWF